MYVQHFGLMKRPFRAKATGTDVFVGPQTVTAIAGLKTALQANDSVVTLLCRLMQRRVAGAGNLK